jgi:hypothetical protein
MNDNPTGRGKKPYDNERARRLARVILNQISPEPPEGAVMSGFLQEHVEPDDRIHGNIEAYLRDMEEKGHATEARDCRRALQTAKIAVWRFMAGTDDMLPNLKYASGDLVRLPARVRSDMLDGIVNNIVDFVNMVDRKPAGMTAGLP